MDSRYENISGPRAVTPTPASREQRESIGEGTGLLNWQPDPREVDAARPLWDAWLEHLNAVHDYYRLHPLPSFDELEEDVALVALIEKIDELIEALHNG